MGLSLRVVPYLLAVTALLIPEHALGKQSARPMRSLVAREMLRLYLRSGQTTPYEGEQITQTFGAAPTETRQIVKRAGRGRLRIEYLSPPHRKGEILLMLGSRFFHYVPEPRPRLVESETAPLDGGEQVRQLLDDVRVGRVQVACIGEQTVAGREARILDVRSGNQRSYRRLWLDTQTGVRLKHETISGDGRLMATAYFTRISYWPALDFREFRPESLPQAPVEFQVPASPPLDSLEKAEQQAGFPIKRPAVPPGYQLQGIWVMGTPGARSVLLRYSDGVNTFLLTQRPVPPLLRRAGIPNMAGTVARRRGSATWVAADRVYVLFGHLSPYDFATLRRSLR